MIRWTSISKQYFEKYGLTLRQFNVLRILRGNYPGPYTTHMIRVRMLDQMSDVSRIIERLVKKGYVTSTTCLTDKRLVDVVINDRGMNLLAQMDETMVELDKIFSNLSIGEQKTLNRLLDKLRDNNA